MLLFIAAWCSGALPGLPGSHISDHCRCLFELFTAIRNRRTVDIRIVLPPSEQHKFLAVMSAGDYTALESALDTIRSENSTASVPADLAAIQGYIRELPGGFAALDETVRGHLRRWFEGQGAVLSSSRVQALRRGSQLLGQRSTLSVEASQSTQASTLASTPNSTPPLIRPSHRRPPRPPSLSTVVNQSALFANPAFLDDDDDNDDVALLSLTET